MASFATFGNQLYTGSRSYDIVGHRRRWFTAAVVLVLLSILVLGVRGLNAGIEFSGGSEFTVSGTSTPEEDIAHEVLTGVDADQVARVSIVGGDSVRVQTEELTDTETTELAGLLAQAYDVAPEDVTSSFVGPAWGQDVTTKALQALVIFLILVSAVMALYFRRWTMAVAALVALLHDVVLTVGIYAAIGFEVTPATVIGFLTILGYSLYDTVVVFDKVRENTAELGEQTRYTYSEGANLAVNQTLVRSINTSVVGVLPVAAILFIGAFLLGAGTLRDIALALFIGMIASTASSIFIATPLHAFLESRRPPIAEHTQTVFARREAALEEAHARGEDEPVLAGTGGLVAGGHQGHEAQPRRKRGRPRK
ncbi:protein translocase subunit SecF [Ruania halotolerans]|uniref:protein translocase subunit SecF n=1 Tax=Ruania halotolerans TaxID=2897773 RepID=UPI001E637FAB|nr:protein translocase subunit SecF [Ruania halotolerans]UFU04762.1 protein translocase subunit SecF [Ruania halotolerans]